MILLYLFINNQISITIKTTLNMLHHLRRLNNFALFPCFSSQVPQIFPLHSPNLLNFERVILENFYPVSKLKGFLEMIVVALSRKGGATLGVE